MSRGLTAGCGPVLSARGSPGGGDENSAPLSTIASTSGWPRATCSWSSSVTWSSRSRLAVDLGATTGLYSLGYYKVAKLRVRSSPKPAQRRSGAENGDQAAMNPPAFLSVSRRWSHPTTSSSGGRAKLYSRPVGDAHRAWTPERRRERPNCPRPGDQGGDLLPAAGDSLGLHFPANGS